MQKAAGWLREEYSFRYGYEMQYARIERKLFAEEYLETLTATCPITSSGASTARFITFST